jgi:hypothetical protein
MDFVVVTALEEERDAVLSKLQGSRKLPRELETYEPYESNEREDLVDQYPSTLQAMAWNSAKIFGTIVRSSQVPPSARQRNFVWPHSNTCRRHLGPIFSAQARDSNSNLHTESSQHFASSATGHA